VRNADLLRSQIDAALWIAEAQRPLTQIVAHAQQVVRLAEASLRTAALIADPMLLGAIDEPAAPAVRRTIRERTKHGAAGRGLVLARRQRQPRVERICLGVGKVPGVVGERR